MKRKTVLLVLVAFIFTFTLPLSAMASSQGKALFMENIKIQQALQMQSELNQPFDGEIDLNITGETLKTFGFENILANLKFDMDVENSQAFFKIDGSVAGNKPQAINLEFYIIDDTMIIPVESLKSIAKLDPGMEMPAENVEYLYTKLEGFSFAELQAAFNQSSQQEAAMALVETIFEAMPDKCFSAWGKTAELSLDKQAITSFADNFKDEKFVTKLAEQIVAINPEDSNKDEIISQITCPEDVSFTDILKNLTIRKCKSTISPDRSSSDWDLSYNDEKLNIGFKINSNATIRNEKIVSDVHMELGFKSAADNENVAIKLDADSITNQKKSSCNGNLKLDGKVSDMDLQGLASFKINMQFKDKVSFVSPVLTSENSMDMDELMPDTGDLSADIITVKINDDQYICFIDNAPFIEEDRIMVPVRELGNYLDYEVDWNPPATVVMANADKTITLKIGSKEYNVNGQNKEIYRAPVIKDGVTYVSIRFIAEELGYEVSYNPEYHEVSLTNK